MENKGFFELPRIIWKQFGNTKTGASKAINPVALEVLLCLLPLPIVVEAPSLGA
jgi:hypothetical protein